MVLSHENVFFLADLRDVSNSIQAVVVAASPCQGLVIASRRAVCHTGTSSRNDVEEAPKGPNTTRYLFIGLIPFPFVSPNRDKQRGCVVGTQRPTHVNTSRESPREVAELIDAE